MNRISINQAWSNATAFFSGQAASHAILLIGIGIVVPLVLQFMLGGGAAMSDPMAMAAGGGFAAIAALAILSGLVSYILQMASYFASWRIGLTDGREPLGGAIGYGVIAALPVLLVGLVVLLAIGVLAFVVLGSAIAPVLMGGQPSKAAIASTGVLMLLLLPLFLLFCVWLAARFCCMGPVMADRRSFNVIMGLGESWRMTAASQWKIFAYFILLGIASTVILGILAAIVGVSMFASGGIPGTESIIGLTVGGLLVGIPIAYLQVGVPVGIYRALGGQASQGDIFA